MAEAELELGLPVLSYLQEPCPARQFQEAPMAEPRTDEDRPEGDTMDETYGWIQAFGGIPPWLASENPGVPILQPPDLESQEPESPTSEAAAYPRWNDGSTMTKQDRQQIQKIRRTVCRTS